jgi:long-chain acyl-CoA synthetase
MPRSNLLSLFDDFRRNSRDVAVVQRRGYRRESWTYAKLAQISFLCGRELKERGVRNGDRVLLWGPNSAEWMAAFWAACCAAPLPSPSMMAQRPTSPRVLHVKRPPK